MYKGEFEGKKVAIKSLKDDHRGLQAFLAEASVMTDLSHPHLVQLIGVSLDEKPVFIVTEFMEKGSLVDYLRTRGKAIIQKKDQLGFARDVADGMAYLEHKDLIHRWEGCLCSWLFSTVLALNQDTLLPVELSKPIKLAQYMSIRTVIYTHIYRPFPTDVTALRIVCAFCTVGKRNTME